MPILAIEKDAIFSHQQDLICFLISFPKQCKNTISIFVILLFILEKMIQPFDDVYFMKKALQEAETGFAKGEIPVGAVIVLNNQIIARAHNLTETLNDVTAHAEMQAFTAAADYLGGKYLKECILYVTLEPCQMCAGASYWTQIGKIVYGASELQRGFLHTKTTLHPKTLVLGGILENDCSQILKRFFIEKRNLN